MRARREAVTTGAGGLVRISCVACVAWAAWAPLALVACGAAPARPRAETAQTIASTSPPAEPADIALSPARLVPENVGDKPTYGFEPGGDTRTIVAGLRLLTSRGGAAKASEQRFASAPSAVTALPPHLGSGFLYVIGATVWRSDKWLDKAVPIFTSPQAIQQVLPGLDRVYVKTTTTFIAVDGKTGRVLDLGPWPRTSFVASYAAVDSWRAAAITDLRGVLVTSDAGATWRPVDVPMDPKHVVASGSALLVGADDEWYEIRSDLGIAEVDVLPPEAVRLSSKSKANKSEGGGTNTTSTSVREPPKAEDDDATRILGKRPLVAAIEDGLPAGDGTAVVFRDGAIAHVRLSDGRVTFLMHDAFGSSSARCHPLALGQARPGELGFVCGDPSGKTVIYAYDTNARRARMLRSFDRPRVVTSGGNGTLAVRGSCSAGADPGPLPHDVPTAVPIGASSEGSRKGATDGKESKGERHPPAQDKPPVTAVAPQPFCIMNADRSWREVVVRGDTVSPRVVALSNGSIAVVSPPTSPEGGARLTILSNGQGNTVPVTFARVPADVARVLRLGVWLDGFEERRPGVLGGWLEAGGTVLGVELTLDGHATAGQFVRDAGLPFVSGRYGFGFSAAKRGYETTDGGMTWTSMELPEPLLAATKVDKRAVGPVGAMAAGWLRVGWGERRVDPAPEPPPAYRASTSLSPPLLDLACEPIGPAAPPVPVAERRPTTSTSPRGALAPRFSSGVLAPAAVAGVATLPPFYREAPPALSESERGLPIEVQELPDRSVRIGPMARVYAWGPRSGDWDTQGKWLVRWLSPFEGFTSVRSSMAVLPPSTVVDLSRIASGYGYASASYGYGSSGWQFVPGDDAAHGLLVQKQGSPASLSLYELSSEREPMLVRRADGEPFLELEGAVRTAGTWIVATPTPSGSAHPVTVLWQIDSGVAHELARIPRLLPETGRPTASRLARHSDGTSVGFVIDGQTTPERNIATRWVLPIDLRTGQKGEPIALGYADFAGQVLEPCADDEAGFVFDTTLPSATLRMDLPRGAGSLHGLYARVRSGAGRTCALAISGIFDGQSAEREALLVASSPKIATPKDSEIRVTALSMQTRHSLRCVPKQRATRTP